MGKSRTENTIRNLIWGTANKIIIVVFPFILRTIIIKVLGNEYLGLNSLFTSILHILNLSELGISSAIVYSMYKPIANNDKDTICGLMNLYKKVYRVIGICVLVLGLMLLPFLNVFIKKDVPDDINIYILYCIYLFNTVLSYLMFAYKTALINAFQRNDLQSKINLSIYLLQSIAQIILLFVYKNYYLYIIVMPIFTILNNIVCALVVKRTYPEYVAKGTVSKEIKQELKKKVSGLMVYKICGVTRNSFDSIFISAFLGLNMVAIYNNYYLILNAIITFLGVITSSMLASIGNSVAVESVDKNYKDMNKLNYIYMWISGWCTVCLLCLFQPFMNLWLGEKYMFPFSVVVLFCIYFFSLKMGDIRFAYSEAAGLWWENRYRAIAEAIANVVLNYVLGKFFGIYGIIAGTVISLIIINFFYGTKIVFVHYFKGKKVSEYFISVFKYAFITLIASIVTLKICDLVNINKFLDLIVKGIICCIVPNIIFFVIYRKSEHYEYAKSLVLKIIKRK